MHSVRPRGRSLDSPPGNVNWNFCHSDHGCHFPGCKRPLPQKKIPPREHDSEYFCIRAPLQLKWRGVYSGLLVWIIFGLGLFILSISSSSSFSWSLSHTWTTTLGVVSVAACNSYFSPGERREMQGDSGKAAEAKSKSKWKSMYGSARPGFWGHSLGTKGHS